MTGQGSQRQPPTDDLDPVFKALADPTRRELLDLLKERPHTTGELAERFPDLSRYGVMKHLATLVSAGLVTVRRTGRHRWNELNPMPLQLIYERWMHPYEALWAGPLLGLKRRAERSPSPESSQGA